MSTQTLNGGINNTTNTTNQNQREKTIDLAKIMVSRFERTKQTENPKQISLKEFLDDIKSSEVNKRLYLTASKIEDKNLLSDFKRTELFGVTLSVLCKNRKAGTLEDSIISKTGILQTDFDNLSPEKMNELKGALRLDENVVFFFNSISGNGIKAGYLIDPDKHLESFEAIQAKFKVLNNIEIDRSVKDLRRLCYTSSDHNLYINEKAVPFRLDEVKKQKAARTSRVTKSSGVNINSLETLLVQVKKILMEHGELGKRHFGRREAGRVFGNYIAEASISLDEGVKLLLDFIVTNNLTSDEELAKSDLFEFITYGMDYKKTFHYNRTNSDESLHEIQSNRDIFWTISENDSGKKSVKIDIYRLMNFLSSSGIIYINLGNEKKVNYRFVVLKNNIIEEITEEYISRLLRNFIELKIVNEDEKSLLIGELFNTIPYLTDPRRLTFGVLTQDINFLKDEKDKSYFFFSNLVIEISKDGIRELKYSEIDGVIWRSNIINKEFKRMSDSEVQNFMFSKFITNTCKDPNSGDTDNERLNSLLIMIGYLLHRFKTPRNNKSIVLSEDNLEDIANGRTGKSLIMNAISYLRKTLKLDGRRVKINSEFLFQDLDHDTDIIYLDDIFRQFKFELFYSSTSEGVRFRRIYEAEQWLSFENSPKFVLSTNYGLQGNSESDKARKFEMELLSYYNSTRTPDKEFDCYFFHDWNSIEWNLFYNFMLDCSKLYFQNDCKLKQYNSNTLELKKLVSTIGKDFYEFAETLPRDEFIPNSEIYSSYISFLGVDESDITKKGISYKIKTYCQSVGLEYESTQKRINDKNTRGYIIYSKLSDIVSGDLLGEVA